METIDKKEMANSILMEHGNYEWLTSSGSFTILNNGVEFAVTYLIMTLVLLIFGGGQFTSADYYAKKFIENKINKWIKGNSASVFVCKKVVKLKVVIP